MQRERVREKKTETRDTNNRYQEVEWKIKREK